MEKDKFNEAIRKKLEQIDPKFSADEWQDTKAFMAAQIVKPGWWDLYGKVLSLFSAGVILLGSLFLNYKLLNENKTLLDNKFNVAVVPTMERGTYLTDTVYVDKIIYKTKTIYKIINGEKADAKKNIGVSAASPNELFTNESSSKNNMLNGDLELKSGESKLENSQSDYLNDKSQDSFKKSVASFKDGNYKLSKNSSLEVKNEGVNIPANSNLEPKESEKPNNNNNSTYNLDEKVAAIEFPIERKQLSNFNLEKIASLKYKPKVLEEELKNRKLHYNYSINKSPKKDRISIHIPKSLFENMHYRYGISADFGNEQTAFGLTNELLLNPNWAIYGGLRYTYLKGNEYYTGNQYNLDTKLDFKNQFASAVNTQGDFLNITFQNNFIQMPLGFTYRYPLNNNFKLLFTLGTDLDLFGKAFVAYDFSADGTKYQEGKSSSKISNPIFNNGLLSVGLEKKYKNYVFQVQPYLSAQWKTSIYKRNDVLAGVKFRIMLETGRNK